MKTKVLLRRIDAETKKLNQLLGLDITEVNQRYADEKKYWDEISLVQNEIQRLENIKPDDTLIALSKSLIQDIITWLFEHWIAIVLSIIALGLFIGVLVISYTPYNQLVNHSPSNQQLLKFISRDRLKIVANEICPVNISSNQKKQLKITNYSQSYQYFADYFQSKHNLFNEKDINTFSYDFSVFYCN